MGLRGPIKKTKAKPLEFVSSLPPPPSYLDAAGKRKYMEASRQLELAGADLQQPDGAILAIFAQAVADVERLSKEIRKEGEVVQGRQEGMVRNPKCQVLEAAKKMAMNSGAKLGFSPVDRARVPASKTKQGRKNEFENF